MKISVIKQKNKGFVALLSVLIIGAVALAVTVGLLLLGLGSARTSSAYEESKMARALADACAEEALQQIVDSSTFTTASTSLSFARGGCSYTVTNTGGQNRSIATVGIIGTIVRKVTINIDSINPSINIVSWQEVAG